jgi:UDP-3-O-[3-hydroxymyristoyl] glucosamine N-acyltransferase
MEPVRWTTGEVARLVGAQCEGPSDRELSSVASLDRAGATELTFCTGGRWLAELAATHAGAVLLASGGVPHGVVALRHKNPRWAFAVAAAAMHPVPWPEPGVHPRAEVHASARVAGTTIEAFAVVEAGATVGAGSWIQAHAYVGPGVAIGSRCRIMPGAVIMDGCTLGDRVWLKPGAVVGADGFGFALGEDGPVKVPQLGHVVLEDDVEVGANSSVDRAALGETRVGRGTRLDNLVQVAHNVHIGSQSLLAAFSGVAGGARLGDGVIMGGRSAVVDGVRVGHRATLAALTSASRDVAPGARLGGSPARPYREWLREMASLRALPGLLRLVDAVDARVRALEAAGEGER